MAGNGPVLEVKGISKQFYGFYALSEVDFDVRPGEVHALLGENGAGKSTLIKILAGVNPLEEGRYLVAGKDVEVRNPRDAQDLGINVVFQELNLVHSLSVAENVFFGRLPKSRLFGKVDWKKLREDTRRLLAEVGLDIDPKTKTAFLSVAQQQLVEIARALSFESRVIAMDEPTSALSHQEIERLFGLIERLKERGVGIIYVSHKLDELFRITDRVTVLRDGRKVGEVATTQTDEEELVRLMVGRRLESLYTKAEVETGEVAFEASGLTSNYIKGASFFVRKGEVIGFSGLMGAGRTELARAILGLDRTTAGEIRLKGNGIPRNSPSRAMAAGVGYVPESRKEDGLVLTASVKENMTLGTLKSFSKNGRIDKSREHDAVRESIGKLRIKTRSPEQKILSLSGGNQQKVILARWLMKENLEVLIMDEPTRGIDVGSKSEIYDLISELSKRGIAVVVMSSEMPELISMCDRIYVMKSGRIVREFPQGESSQEALMNAAIGGA